MELKERLATLRQTRGYSLRVLRERIAEHTGELMAISYLSELERLGGAPSMEVLTKIAAGYGMTLRELLAPVEAIGETSTPPYSAAFLSFATRREFNDVEKEDLWRVVYRGNRPETEDDWELLYVTLQAIDRGRPMR